MILHSLYLSSSLSLYVSLSCQTCCCCEYCNGRRDRLFFCDSYLPHSLVVVVGVEYTPILPSVCSHPLCVGISLSLLLVIVCGYLGCVWRGTTTVHCYIHLLFCAYHLATCPPLLLLDMFFFLMEICPSGGRQQLDCPFCDGDCCYGHSGTGFRHALLPASIGGTYLPLFILPSITGGCGICCCYCQCIVPTYALALFNDISSPPLCASHVLLGCCLPTSFITTPVLVLGGADILYCLCSSFIWIMSLLSLSSGQKTWHVVLPAAGWRWHSQHYRHICQQFVLPATRRTLLAYHLSSDI